MSVQGLPIAMATDISPGFAMVVERFVSQARGGDFLHTDALAQPKKALGFDARGVIQCGGGVFARGSQIIVKFPGPLDR